MSDRDDALDRLCSLDDPTRRRLYDHVVSQAEPVSREDAATALDLDRSVVAYHLDKLVEQGLLSTSFFRPDGRGGPGAGRPAKHYERSDAEVSVSVPPRDYRLAAELLARAAEADGSGAVRDALGAAARAIGQELVESAEAEDASDLEAFLLGQGFEPYDDGGVLRLRNCPFHRLAREHTELICGMNVELLGAVAERFDDDVQATLDPTPDRCCVAFRR